MYQEFEKDMSQNNTESVPANSEVDFILSRIDDKTSKVSECLIGTEYLLSKINTVLITTSIGSVIITVIVLTYSMLRQ